MPYCSNCGFYYESTCEVCSDEGHIEETAFKSRVEREEEQDPGEGWVLLLLSVYMMGVLTYHLYTDGLDLQYLVPYGASLGLYLIAIDVELRYIYEYADLDGWEPDVRTWRYLGAGVVGTCGALAILVTPYYLYRRFKHVSDPEASE